MQRNTTQRQAIQRVMQEVNRPLGPDEIFESAKTYCPGLGIATVYRAIKELVDTRQLTIVNLPGEPSRYEMAGKGHHHFFFCRHCKKKRSTSRGAPAISALSSPPDSNSKSMKSSSTASATTVGKKCRDKFRDINDIMV